MLTVSSIKNVQSTINNKNISFKAGVQSNFGADVINNTASIKKEGSFLTDFLGTVKQSPIFYETFLQRQQSIEKGINVEKNKINTIV